MGTLTHARSRSSLAILVDEHGAFERPNLRHRLASLRHQHPHLVPRAASEHPALEETGWFSRLTLTLQSCHEDGSARGERSQLSAMLISRDELLQTVGDAINAMILRQRSVYEAASAEVTQARGTPPDPAFLLTRNPNDPKGRWVDGTPEYSLSAFALRILFPEARFIHILRDVRAVVRSLMRFSDLAGYQLVKTEEEAYRYWLRTTRACLVAGRAFGSDGVHRVRYRVLVEAPQASLRSCLEFLGETYSADCLMPLKEKINSSNVHGAFDPTDERTDPALREEAHEFFDALDAEEPARVGAPGVSTQLETEFLKRAHFVAWAECEMTRRQEMERFEVERRLERESTRRGFRLFRGRGAR
jgi:hypothetical protein